MSNIKIEEILNQDALDKLTIIWNALKEKCLYMKIVGSHIIPIIKNKGDIDIVFVYPNDSIGWEVRQPLIKDKKIKEIRWYLKNTYNLGIFGVSLKQDNIRGRNIFYLCRDDILLFGNREQKEDIDVIKNTQMYKDIVNKYFDQYVNRYERSNNIPKALYHILAAKYHYENNSYDLTEEQIENINILHDAEDSTYEKRKELFFEIKEWLEQ